MQSARRQTTSQRRRRQPTCATSRPQLGPKRTAVVLKTKMGMKKAAFARAKKTLLTRRKWKQVRCSSQRRLSTPVSPMRPRGTESEIGRAKTGRTRLSVLAAVCSVKRAQAAAVEHSAVVVVVVAARAIATTSSNVALRSTATTTATTQQRGTRCGTPRAAACFGCVCCAPRLVDGLTRLLERRTRTVKHRNLIERSTATATYIGCTAAWENRPFCLCGSMPGRITHGTTSSSAVHDSTT